MGYLGCQKIIEGSIFRGHDSTSKLFSDLRGTGWPQIRPPRSPKAEHSKNANFFIQKVAFKEATEVVEAMEVVEATEVVEAIEAAEVAEVMEAADVVEALIQYFTQKVRK